MLKDLIKNTRHLGSVYSGRILSFDDLDTILTRLPNSKEFVIFANKVTKKDISNLLSTINVNKSGLFKRESINATEFFIEHAFYRNGFTFYVSRIEDENVTIIMPSENVTPERCILIEDK